MPVGAAPQPQREAAVAAVHATNVLVPGAGARRTAAHLGCVSVAGSVRLTTRLPSVLECMDAATGAPFA